jgi:hypothetical protein
MSTLTWDQVLEEQQRRVRVLSPERMRAEMAWSQLTCKAPAIFGPAGDVPCPIRPPPIAPRGRGKRKVTTTRVVAVERRRTKLVTCPNGAILAAKRTAHSYLTIAA